jgi:hypothetical protein
MVPPHYTDAQPDVQDRSCFGPDRVAGAVASLGKEAKRGVGLCVVNLPPGTYNVTFNSRSSHA